MGQYTSYWMYQKYETRGEQDPIPVYPNYWSVDADGTLPRITKLENDEECGYRPDAQYRWVNMDITKDYYCDECSVMTRWVKSNETICVEDEPEPQYRTLTTATTCVGYDLHVLEEHQVSTDGGVTWTTTATTTGSLIEADSEDCGYVPPVPTGTKWIATYFDGTQRHLCDSRNEIEPNEVQNKGSLYSIRFGNCFNKIGSEAFNGAKLLKSIELTNNITVLDYYAFSNCSGLTSVTISDTLTTIGEGTFRYCTKLTNINIPNSVSNIGDRAFYYCSGLTSITLSSSVTSIGESAFENCRGLRNVNIQGGSIGNSAFYNCYKITSCTIGNGVTSIGDASFAYCSGMTNCTIGNGVTSIGEAAFWWCHALTSITIEATTPPSLGDSVFKNTNISAIYVPSASVDTYKSATGWSTYASRIQAIP